MLAQSPGLGGPSTAPAGTPNPEGDKVGAAWVCLRCTESSGHLRAVLVWAMLSMALLDERGEDVTSLVTQETPWVVFLLHPVKAYLVFFFLYIVPCFAANSTHLVLQSMINNCSEWMSTVKKTFCLVSERESVRTAQTQLKCWSVDSVLCSCHDFWQERFSSIVFYLLAFFECTKHLTLIIPSVRLQAHYSSCDCLNADSQKCLTIKNAHFVYHTHLDTALYLCIHRELIWEPKLPPNPMHERIKLFPLLP